MTYYLMGTGNMAHFVAQRMNAAGHVCTGIWGRDSDKAARLARAHHFHLIKNIADIHDGPNACLMAVSDSAIAELALTLQLSTTTLVHFAGSVSLGKLAAGATHTGILWPLYSIRKESLPAVRKFPCILEANDDQASDIIREVAKAISDTAVQLSGEQRQWLHIAAVMSNNFTTYLLGIADQICSDQRIPFSLLQPILGQLIKNIETQRPEFLQTGPARRGDVESMAHQLQMISDKPHWQEVYKALSAAISKDFSSK